MELLWSDYLQKETCDYCWSEKNWDAELTKMTLAEMGKDFFKDITDHRGMLTNEYFKQFWDIKNRIIIEQKSANDVVCYVFSDCCTRRICLIHLKEIVKEMELKNDPV